MKIFWRAIWVSSLGEWYLEQLPPVWNTQVSQVKNLQLLLGLSSIEGMLEFIENTGNDYRMTQRGKNNDPLDQLIYPFVILTMKIMKVLFRESMIFRIFTRRCPMNYGINILLWPLISEKILLL